jgi:hypothetical protein
MQKKVISKGYTLEVTSWENDGDNYCTKMNTYNTKEEAIAVRRLCNIVFVSCNNGDGGIGNLNDGEEGCVNALILNFFIRFPDLLTINQEKTPYDFEKEVREAFPDIKENEKWIDYIFNYMDDHEDILEGWIDIVLNYNYELMGGSEHYYSRVFESSSLYYSDRDIYLQRID